MYNPIKISPTKEMIFNEKFSLDPVKEQQNIFNEAVFVNGESIMKPIEDQFQAVKNKLDEELAKHSAKNTKEKFDPDNFIKDIEWKKLEDLMVKTFGFRNVDILHWNERYIGHSEFETMELNCYTWPTWRYPIDGLVTDKGFYDSTRSISTQVSYSLGIIKNLNANELTAIFLHELGHNIDPALVDIKYTKANVLSKYLTDREDSITSNEKKIEDRTKSGKIGFMVEIFIFFYGIVILSFLLSMIINLISILTFDENKAIKKLKNAIHEDSEEFNRHKNQEAFADNFARMYGYGPALMSALSKIGNYYDKQLKSRCKRETERQYIVSQLIMGSLKDIHKSDMHRMYNLVKEYKADLNNPKIPNKVKEGIKEDLNELEKVIEMHLNSPNKFKNRLNKLILDELKKIDNETPDDNVDKNNIPT